MTPVLCASAELHSNFTDQCLTHSCINQAQKTLQHGNEAYKAILLGPQRMQVPRQCQHWRQCQNGGTRVVRKYILFDCTVAISQNSTALFLWCVPPYSALTFTRYPFAFSNACCLALAKSFTTISRHISCAVISGTQPSLAFALDGSPNSVSTSAGRK